jgi:hypothetical protein
MDRWGNARANLYWEHNWKGGDPHESSIEVWIRQKYEKKMYAMSQTVPDPSTLQSTESNVIPIKIEKKDVNKLIPSQTQQLFAAFETQPTNQPITTTITTNNIKNDIMSLFDSPNITTKLEKPITNQQQPVNVTSVQQPVQQPVQQLAGGLMDLQWPPPSNQNQNQINLQPSSFQNSKLNSTNTSSTIIAGLSTNFANFSMASTTNNNTNNNINNNNNNNNNTNIQPSNFNSKQQQQQPQHSNSKNSNQNNNFVTNTLNPPQPPQPPHSSNDLDWMMMMTPSQVVVVQPKVDVAAVNNQWDGLGHVTSLEHPVIDVAAVNQWDGLGHFTSLEHPVIDVAAVNQWDGLGHFTSSEHVITVAPAPAHANQWNAPNQWATTTVPVKTSSVSNENQSNWNSEIQPSSDHSWPQAESKKPTTNWQESKNTITPSSIVLPVSATSFGMEELHGNAWDDFGEFGDCDVSSSSSYAVRNSGGNLSVVTPVDVVDEWSTFQ